MCYAEAVRVVVVLYVAAMIALIIGLDVTLFRHHFWERLAANVGIVLLFAAFYFRFLRGA
jgi:cytochrome c oxidase subunit IV